MDEISSTSPALDGVSTVSQACTCMGLILCSSLQGQERPKLAGSTRKLPCTQRAWRLMSLTVHRAYAFELDSRHPLSCVCAMHPIVLLIGDHATSFTRAPTECHAISMHGGS